MPKHFLSKVIGAVLAIAFVATGGVALAASSASAPANGQQANGRINQCVNTKTAAVTARLATSCPAGTVALSFYPQPAEQRTNTATTKLNARNDSGTQDNDWAVDTILRTAGVKLETGVDATKCGAAAARCYFYTGEITDLGTFKTKAGASPGSAALIPAGITGNVAGGETVEFYSTAPTQLAAGVPPTVTGNDISTTDWFRQFFPAGTVFAGHNVTSWGWTYTATSTTGQGTWVNSLAGNTGNILPAAA